MIRKKKLFVRPLKPFESIRIKDENALLKQYGLKNKREVWKALAKVNYFRKRAMELEGSSSEEQANFFKKLNLIGLNVESTADVLDLKVENFLERRLPSIVHKKGLADTPQHARQLVVHKKIVVDETVVNTPSFIVSTSIEGKISLKKKKAKPKPAPVKEEPAAETPAEAQTEPAAETTETPAEEKKEESE